MRQTSAILLTFLALAGCAGQQSATRETVSPAAEKRSIIGLEVTNTFDRTIDVYNGTQFLGTLAPHAHGSYTLPPATAAVPIYARFTDRPDQSFNLSRERTVRYIYGAPSAGG